jgi:hypothetical protein
MRSPELRQQPLYFPNGHYERVERARGLELDFKRLKRLSLGKRLARLSVPRRTRGRKQFV